jgi:hypothetical protein
MGILDHTPHRRNSIMDVVHPQSLAQEIGPGVRPKVEIPSIGAQPGDGEVKSVNDGGWICPLDG